MKDATRVRPARSSEIGSLAKLVKARLPDMMSNIHRTDSIESHLAQLVPDQALLVATHGARLAGVGALDLDNKRILACYLDPEVASPETPRNLFQSLEKHALRFGIRRLDGVARKRVTGFMKSLGYSATPDAQYESLIVVSKDLLDAASEETREVFRLCDELGVPENYGVDQRMPLVPEATELTSAGSDIF